MSEILGKVTGSIEVARGADVSLRITVPRLWLFEGRSIEIELPRNLVCAECSGGGCGRCQNSGAITLRGRDELAEVVQVCLPEQGDTLTRLSMQEIASRNGVESKADSTGKPVAKSVRPMTIRIPECGGLPDSGSIAKVRGWLLLHVGIAEQASSNVRLLDDEEPLSSSKMVRAETKHATTDEVLLDAQILGSGGETQGTGCDLEEEEPLPLTRMAKVRSMRISDPQALRRKSDSVEPSLVTVGPAEPVLMRRSGWLWGVALGALVGCLLSLWMWYFG